MVVNVAELPPNHHPSPNNLQETRAHWRIENSLHGVWVIAFCEDESRLRKGNGPQNFAVLRHIALNLLKQTADNTLGIQHRRLPAGWDND